MRFFAPPRLFRPRACVQITVCHITSDGNPKTFETIVVPEEEWPALEAAGDLDAPCRDYIGPLCDDGIKCTIDFDYEAGVCLPEPREVVPTCVETMDT